MLKLFKIIVYAIAFTVNIFTRFMSVKANRIVFISYFSNKPEGNFKAICEAVEQKGGYDVVLLLKKYEGTLKSKLLYFINIIKQAYFFNTAKVVVLDANSVVMNAIIKKRKTIVLQIWHACGALKKFGSDTKKRLYNIKSCDFAISSCEKVRAIYADALNIPIKNVYALGSPRADALFNQERTNSLKKIISDKYAIPSDKVVLYAPTFRGGGIDDVSMLPIDIAGVAEKIKDKYTLAIRLHPLIRDFCCPENVIDLTNDDLISVLCAADLLVSDYSTIMFEYAILERPMIFHAPDLDNYKQARGFYMDYEEFVPGKITKTFDELVYEINNIKPDIGRIKRIKQEYFDYHDENSTERVVEFIEKLTNAADVDCPPLADDA